MEGYIYIIKNTNNDKVYIGQTSRSIQDRWKQHIQSAQRGDEHGIILYNAMRKYGIETFFIEQLEEVELEQLNDREIYWIKFYNSQTPNGYNVREGGEDPGRKAVYKIDILTNQIIGCYGSAMAAAEENNIDLSQLTKVCRHEPHCNSCGGFKWSYIDNYDEAVLNNIKAHIENYGICQVDSNTGILIKEWESIQQAANELKIQQSDISHCLSGRYRTAGGYNWCKKENFQTFTPKTQFKQVIQYDLNGNELKIWNNAKEAGETLNLGISTIRAAARGARKTAYGYKWKYKEN